MYLYNIIQIIYVYLTRLPDGVNPVNNTILDTVISIGSFVVIFLIFLIAVGLVAVILIYYANQVVVSNSYALYAAITFTIGTFGLIILDITFISK